MITGLHLCTCNRSESDTFNWFNVCSYEDLLHFLFFIGFIIFFSCNVANTLFHVLEKTKHFK